MSIFMLKDAEGKRIKFDTITLGDAIYFEALRIGIQQLIDAGEIVPDPSNTIARRDTTKRGYPAKA